MTRTKAEAKPRPLKVVSGLQAAGRGRSGPGLTAANFRKIAPNGFGDPLNAYPHSMIWFRDHLYVGTTRANLANRGVQISSKTPDRLGDIWPVRIPKSGFDNDLRAQIWRYQPSTGEWSKVFTSPTAKGIDGFEVPISIGFRCMISFQGPSDSAPALYVPTWATYQTPTTYMLRSVDGVTFDIVSEPGKCTPDSKPWGLRGLVAFKGLLFASPTAGARHEPNIAGLMAVTVSRDPVKDDWKLACEPRFGDPNNLSVFQMAVFNGFLYAGTLNINEGFQIWKTDASGKPPFRWRKVLSHGAYRGKLNQIGMTLVPFGDYLYVGTAIQNGGFDFDNLVGPAAPEVLRLAPDDSWDLVVGEPRLTPDGLKIPLSGLGAGFNNPFSGYLWSMCVHDGWLYAGSAVWTVFMRYAGGKENLPANMKKLMRQDTLNRMLRQSGGCDLWRTRDGSAWLPVTRNGFGNYYNVGIRNMVSTPHGLFIGTANSFTPEVAVKRLAGWTYEKNPRGGLEIWLGRHDYSAGSVDAPAGVTGKREEIPARMRTTVARLNTSGLISRFYGGSSFRTIGLWSEDIIDAKAACENLMEEMLAFIVPNKGPVLDLGCGRGASTRYLLRCFGQDVITGITYEAGNLTACRRNAPDVRFLVSEDGFLPVEDGAFQVVLTVDGLAVHGRERMLGEISRVLAPGGLFVGFDIVRSGGHADGRNGDGEGIDHETFHRRLLNKAGLRNVRIFDVTSPCINKFKRHMKQFFEPLVLSRQLEMKTVSQISSLLLGEGTPVYAALVSGRKHRGRQ